MKGLAQLHVALFSLKFSLKFRNFRLGPVDNLELKRPIEDTSREKVQKVSF